MEEDLDHIVLIRLDQEVDLVTIEGNTKVDHLVKSHLQVA